MLLVDDFDAAGGRLSYDGTDSVFLMAFAVLRIRATLSCKMREFEE